MGAGTASRQGALGGVGLGNMGGFDLWYRRGKKARGTATRGRCTQRFCTSCLLCPHSAGKSQPLASVTCSTQRLGGARLPRFHSRARTGLSSGILQQRQLCICKEETWLAQGASPSPGKLSLGLLGISCIIFPWAYCKSWKCPRSWQKCPCALWHCPVFLAVPFGQLFLGNAAICSPLIPDTQWEVKGKFLICVWPLGVLAGVL